MLGCRFGGEAAGISQLIASIGLAKTVLHGPSLGIRSRFEIAQADNIRVLWAHCIRDSRDRARADS